MSQCIINNAYCIPGPCANCGRVFCAHEHPEKRAFGYYGQYCTRECQEAKCQQVFERGRERFQYSRVVLAVEESYCYFVLNREKRTKEAKGYGFKILHESAKALDDPLYLDYCHYPGFSMQEYPVTYAIHPKLQVVIYVYDEYDNSVWTMLGFRLLDGEIDTYGVGGHIEVIDLRPNHTNAELIEEVAV